MRKGPSQFLFFEGRQHPTTTHWLNSAHRGRRRAASTAHRGRRRAASTARSSRTTTRCLNSVIIEDDDALPQQRGHRGRRRAASTARSSRTTRCLNSAPRTTTRCLNSVIIADDDALAQQCDHRGRRSAGAALGGVRLVNSAARSRTLRPGWAEVKSILKFYESKTPLAIFIFS